MITAHYIAEVVSSNEAKAFELYDRSRFGEKKGSKIEYSFSEALYLVETKKMVVKDGKEAILTEKTLMTKIAKRDARIHVKLAAYRALREAGYIPKTALKFGAEFRVYQKGVKPGQDHARWVCYPIKESEKHSWYDFAAKNRVAHAAKKKLLLALVDDESDVTFYEVGWVKI